MSQAIYETNSKKHDLMAKYYDGKLCHFLHILRKKPLNTITENLLVYSTIPSTIPSRVYSIKYL